MASLLRRSLRSQRSVETLEDYAALMSQFAYAGHSYGLGGATQTLVQQAERAPSDFVGYVHAAYNTNGVIFACMLVRQLLFSAVRFQYQRFNQGRGSEVFGNPNLAVLERPWPGGTTQDLLARMIQDVDLAGNAFVHVRSGELIRLRPDWVEIVLEPRMVGTAQLGWRRLGYAYYEGGVGAGVPPAVLTPQEVAHFAPLPDPLATFRGMSWITPVIREMQNDGLMARHQRKFFEQGATPSLVVSLKETVSVDEFRRFKAEMDKNHAGTENAYKTLYLGGGADATVVGNSFEQMSFKAIQGHGETRIAAAAGVPPVIVGLSEGLAAATYCGNYNQAVWTTRGVVKLGEVSPGDSVWSVVDGALAPRKVTWHAETGKKPVYAVRTKNRTIRFTDNHPILVRVPGNSQGSNAERGASLQWRRVDQLQVGDRVVQAQRLPDQGGDLLPTGRPATAEALQWLGAYTGDGCLSGDGSVRMCIPTSDRARCHYADLAVRLFTKQTSWRAPGRRADDGLTPEMVRLRAEGLTFRQIVDRMDLTLHPMSVRDRVHTATREVSGATAPVALSESRNGFQFHSRTAVQWHRDMGVTGTARTKRVPGWVFELREDLRLAYLAGIVDTDGSIGKDGRLVVHFANRDLVEDVRMLLISCGIQCSNIARYEYGASVLPNPGAQATYVAWRFTASSAVEVGRIPFADPVYRERVNANQHRVRRGGLDAAKAGLSDDLGFYTVRSIEIEDEEPVFDIEVEDGHCFLADGVVVHNSNYSQARRRFADGTMHPLWSNVAGSLQQIVPTPAGARLWYDATEVPFLREDRRDAAEIQNRQSNTIRQLIDAGYEPDSVISAVEAEDFTLLTHSGLYSVQLRPPGEGDMSAATKQAADADEPEPT